MKSYGQVKGRRYDNEQPVPITDGLGRCGFRTGWRSQPVVVDESLLYPSISQAAAHIGCDAKELGEALRKGDYCCGHKVRRA